MSGHWITVRMGARPWCGCWIWGTRRELLGLRRGWIGWGREFLQGASALVRYCRKNPTIPNAIDRCRRYALGEQHLFRASHRSLYFVSESSRVFSGAGAGSSERCGARIDRDAWLRPAQLFTLISGDV